MIDKFLYTFFGFFDDARTKINNILDLDMDFSHCEKPDCPKKKKKANKNNKYFKS